VKTLAAILGYVVAIPILGALFAPWLYWFLQWLAISVIDSAWLAEQPFRRIFNRSVMVWGLLGLWPLLRVVKIRTWSDLGWKKDAQWFSQASYGFIIGIVSFAIIGIITISFGIRTVAFPVSPFELLGKLVKFISIAVLVGLIEETFFRGGLQGMLQKSMPISSAVALASIVYSALHFLKPGRLNISPGAVHWLSGFNCLSHVFSGASLQFGNILGFVTLFLVGWALGWSYVRKRVLYLAFGLHAGWVFILKSFDFLTRPSGKEFSQWLGAGALIENVITWPVLIGVCIFLHCSLRKSDAVNDDSNSMVQTSR